MNWVERANRYFLNVVSKRRARTHPSSPASAPLPMSPALMDQLVRVDLVSHDGLVGETWMLWGTLADGRLAAISEGEPGWYAMRAALEHSGRLPVALHQAELQLLADPERKPLCLMGEARDAAVARR